MTHIQERINALTFYEVHIGEENIAFEAIHFQTKNQAKASERKKMTGLKSLDSGNNA